jgi:hypothetical protein
MAYRPPPPPPPYVPGSYTVPSATPHHYIVMFEQKGLLPLHDYSKFYAELYSQQGWFHFISNMWILTRTENLYDLQEKLRALIKSEDWLLVMPAVSPAGGILPANAWDWIKLNLRTLSDWQY